MIRTVEVKKERAILVGVVLKGMSRVQEEESLDELSSLAATAGAEVVGCAMQDRESAEPATLIGKGKVHQLARQVEDQQANLVIFDTDLTPVQAKNLEKAFNRKVVDRSGLILDIFAKRARTRESQIQVELAQLQYYLPRLTRLWTHLSRQEAGIGTRGPGETQLETDRRAIRKRINHLKSELAKIEGQRRVRRKHRNSFRKAAIVGYTNVGKSSLLNALTDSQVLVENRLFATLDATIRAMDLDKEGKVLLIDTVGFIRKLPHPLVASFRSTLEETLDADLILHVVDVTHPAFEDQMAIVRHLFEELEIEKKPVITVFNKVDLLRDQSLIPMLKQRFPNVVFISAVKGIGLESLRREIEQSLRNSEVAGEVSVPIEEGRTIAVIHSMVHVVETEYKDDKALIRFMARPELIAQISQMVEGIKHEDTHR